MIDCLCSIKEAISRIRWTTVHITATKESWDDELCQHDAIQIIHLTERNHWAVISTIGCNTHTVNYYDSIFSNISTEAGRIVVNLLKPQRSINANIMNVSSQKGSTECGLYCIAYCTSLAFKVDPCLHVFRQSEMRLHLKSCLEIQQFTQFPVLEKRRLVDILVSQYIQYHCAQYALTLMMEA